MSKNVLLSFASLSLTLLCLEIILRLYPTTDIQTNNPYQYTKTIGKWAFLVPHHSFTHVYPVEFDSRGYYAKTGGVVDYHSNQFGARWISPTEQNIRGKTIFVLGDSYTYGFGLRYEDTYVSKLESRLVAGGRLFTFLNFAVPGADPRRALEIYEKRKHAIPHDVILYGLHLNDLIQFPTSYIITNPTLRYVKISKVMEFVIKRKHDYVDRKRKIGQLLDPSVFGKPFFVANLKALIQLNTIARNSGVDFRVIILPILVDLREDTFKPVYSRVKAHLHESGIQFLDLTPSVKSYADADLWILPFDQHPNEVANGIFAAKLETYFSKG